MRTKDPFSNAIEITPYTKIVIIEGSWLLRDQHPWNQIAHYADDAWFVDVKTLLALQRIAKRYVSSGIKETVEAAMARAENDDMRNGEEI